MLKQLWTDDAGVIISAEIVLVLTILVLGVCVGLVELQCSVVDELNDIGEAIGSLNQSYFIAGSAAFKNGRANNPKAVHAGSSFVDGQDACDGNECNVVCIADATPEVVKY